MKNPSQEVNLWPDAICPENYQPKTSQEWEKAIEEYENDLQKMIALISEPHLDVFKIYPNGLSMSSAAMTVIHHTGYHIGQLKTIGRQLGVW